MHVRPAQVTDAAAIAAAHVATWQRAYRGLLPGEYLDGLDPARWAIGWNRVLADDAPGHVTLVAEDHDGQVVGFADAATSRDDEAAPGTGEVTAIYVLPGHWDTGAGRALMAAAEAALREAGHGAATLWVLRDNDRARRFYERVGWSPDGTEKTDELAGVSVVEVRYRRPL
jgi:GNAT superfamily N-acetyltransferase